MFTKETFDVFIKYEKHVHDKHDKSKAGYENFLCNSPLYDASCQEDIKLPYPQDNIDRHRKLKNEGIFPKSLGSYHMIHRIDGEVAIVGVLDFLDSSLSSVYLFYDPKWEFLSPGTVSALREIEYMKKVRHLTPDPEAFKWYVMGLYYQEC